MAKAPADIRSLARQHTSLAINTLASICHNSENDSARAFAADRLLDRGWGKAPQAITGPDGEGAIKVLIRHIIDGQDINPKVIEHRPNGREAGQDE